MVSRLSKATSTSAAAALLGSALVVSNPGTASALPDHSSTCITGNFLWKWANISDPLWTDGGIDRKGWVVDGLNQLDNALDRFGNEFVDVQGPVTNANVTVRVRDEVLSKRGGAGCDPANLPARFWVNSNFAPAGTGSAFYRTTTRHEAMHLLGAKHGGSVDSRDGNNPATMATCLGTGNYANEFVPEQDMQAYQGYLRSTLPERQLTANIGFEQGTNFYGKTAGIFTTTTSGGIQGPAHLAWSGGNGGNVYQTARHILGFPNSMQYRGKGFVRALTNNYKGFAHSALWYRQVNLPNQPGNPNACAATYANNIVNPNGSATATGWQLLNQSPTKLYGHTDWEEVASSWATPSFNNEALDVRVRLTATTYHVNNANLAGTTAIDNLRAESRDG